MITRRIARPLLASVFISGGIDQLRNPAGKAEAAGPVIDAIKHAAGPVATSAAQAAAPTVDHAAEAAEDAAERSPVATEAPPVARATEAADEARTAVHDVAADRRDPLSDETVIRVNGAVQLTAGVLLATNKAPRLASTALAVTLVPTTLAGHRWWEMDGAERSAHRTQFLKNVALLGGLVLAAADTEGEPSLAWRMRRGRKEAKAAAKVAKANAALALHAASLDAEAMKKLAKANAKVAGKGGELGVEVAGRKARKAAKAARRHAHRASGTADDLRAELAPKVRSAADRAQNELAPKLAAASDRAQAELRPRIAAAGDRAGEVASDLAPRIQAAGHDLADRAAEVAADLSPKIQAAGHVAADRAAELTPRVQAAAQRVAAALPSGS
ncbi:MAG: DoxX family protein [Acidimicrobiales bacterium]|nr:DoxX family protein [Acidimicrobiales bacterium]